MKVLLDSNVFISHIVSGHPHHEQALSILNQLLEEEATIVVSAQIIGEAYAIATSPKRVESPISLERFESLALSFLSDPAVEFATPGIQALQIALRTGIRKNAPSYRIFDLILYGLMRENGITRIATFNAKHFSGLKGIEVVTR